MFAARSATAAALRKVATTSTAKAASRAFTSTTASSAKVAVLGATGGIGQPLSMLCKLSPEVDELACYDVVGTPGVAADLSHIPSNSKTSGYLPSQGTWPPRSNEGLGEALTGSDVVVIPAGVPRKPGMTRDDLFNTNVSMQGAIVELESRIFLSNIPADLTQHHIHTIQTNI